MKKRTPRPGTARADENRTWQVVAVPEVAKTIAHHGLDDPDYTPRLRDLVAKLRADPFQFPSKEGPIAGLRGAPLHYKGTRYRLVYRILKDVHRVRLLALDTRSSSRAYTKAERKLKSEPASDKPV